MSTNCFSKLYSNEESFQLDFYLIHLVWIKIILRFIKQFGNKCIDVNIHGVIKFRNDEQIKKQIRDANTIACFYIESPALRQMLKKLRCDDYLTLVAANSSICPSIVQSHIIGEYVYPYHHQEGSNINMCFLNNILVKLLVKGVSERSDKDCALLCRSDARWSRYFKKSDDRTIT